MTICVLDRIFRPTVSRSLPDNQSPRLAHPDAYGTYPDGLGELDERENRY